MQKLRMVLGGGYPKFHWRPKFVRWGTRLSLFWLRKEYVFFLEQGS